MPEYEVYIHHGHAVIVRSDLRGKHREHCLCWNCEHFRPGSGNNCHAANLVFAVCLAFDLVLPVWECPAFLKKEA